MLQERFRPLGPSPEVARGRGARPRPVARVPRRGCAWRAADGSRARAAAKLGGVPKSSLCSSLLVAMPQLADPNFRRAVVLIVHHDADSTFGLVLNREVELSVRELCESLEFSWHGSGDAEVAWGGPVETNTGWVLFQDDLDTEIEGDHVSRLDGELCFAGSMDVLRQLAALPPQDLRIFLGYAGWGRGQLETELAQGAWVVAPMSPEVVFDVPPESMWEHVLRGMQIDPARLFPTAGVH
jgi:putative transcriptional regulator